jgi:hypothetical protein
MKTRTQSDIKNDQTSGQAFVFKDPVWVQCKGYRCLAYTDATGKRINFYNGKKLTDFVNVIGWCRRWNKRHPSESFLSGTSRYSALKDAGDTPAREKGVRGFVFGAITPQNPVKINFYS